jgi:Ni,Fe-hydrogenase I large subunit
LVGGSGTVEVDPISRIEGHLGVKLTVTSNVVTEADVHGNLWRGFENFLVGRQPNDAITFTQRICGVCPIPHGQVSTWAVDAVHGYSGGMQTWVTAAEGGMWGGETGMAAPAATPAGEGIPLKALLIRNLVLSSEFLMSHMTHLYHLAAPSYVQGPPVAPWTPYFHADYYHNALESAGQTLPTVGADGTYSANLWSAVIKQYVKALRMRRLTFEAGALFAGRMPMTSCFVAGGVTNDHLVDLGAKCVKYRTMMQEIATFIVREFVPLFLALGALYPTYDNVANGGAGAGNGAGCGNFLAWGGFPQADGTLGFARGFVLDAAGAHTTGTITKADVLANLREHIAKSRYEASQTVDNAGVTLPAGVTDPASESRTIPVRNDAAKYSWLKAPRWNGNPMEVGPFARMVVAGYYPTNSTELRNSTGALFGTTFGAIYSRYAKTVGADTGLDPVMIDPDLAVALIRTGAATLKVGTTIVDNIGAPNVHIDSLTAGQIASNYYNVNAVILDGAIPLVSWIYNLKGGLSTMDRLRARALEALVLAVRMIGDFTKSGTGITWSAAGGWVGELDAAPAAGATYIAKATPVAKTFGIGAGEAPRGALMHMCTIENGKISKYQCIVPTTWNACPKDASTPAKRGPMESAMIGIPHSEVRSSFTSVHGTTIDAGGGVEALRVAQSFDPCIACAVH